MKNLLLFLLLFISFNLSAQSGIMDISITPLVQRDSTFEVFFKPNTSFGPTRMTGFVFSFYILHDPGASYSIDTIPGSTNPMFDAVWNGALSYPIASPITIYQTEDGVDYPGGIDVDIFYFYNRSQNATLSLVAGNEYPVIRFKINHMPVTSPLNQLFTVRHYSLTHPNLFPYGWYFECVPGFPNILDNDMTNTNYTHILLPIELLSFTAKWNNTSQTQALAEWTTASEINNKYFVVEHSADALNWSEVAKVDGAGNSNTVRNYSTIDNNPYSKYTYYRLKQVDNDGKYTYSDVVALQKNINSFGRDININIYPNPAYDYVNIEFKEVENELANVSIYDIAGKKLLSEDFYVIESPKKIDINSLPVGIYTLKIRSNSFERIQKLIKN